MVKTGLLFQKNAVLFFFVKMLLTTMGLMICYSYSHLRTARAGIRFVVGIYSVVCIYHMLIVMFG